MGHIRLGRLPRTHQWIQVLDLLGYGAATSQVAAATLRASQTGLGSAARDTGVVHTMWLLTQVPLAARSEEFGTGNPKSSLWDRRTSTWGSGRSRLTTPGTEKSGIYR
jgi:hypothetical protein